MGRLALISLAMTFQAVYSCIPAQTPTTSPGPNATTITEPPTLNPSKPTIMSGCRGVLSDKVFADNGSPCVFPFYDGTMEYTECADWMGKYLWCATSLKSNCMYRDWGKCLPPAETEGPTTDAMITTEAQDVCPKSMIHIEGALSSNDFKSGGLFIDIQSLDECYNLCKKSCMCKGFEFSKKEEQCQLTQEIVKKASFQAIKKDLTICTKQLKPQVCFLGTRVSGCTETRHDFEATIWYANVQYSYQDYRTFIIAIRNLYDAYTKAPKKKQATVDLQLKITRVDGYIGQSPVLKMDFSRLLYIFSIKVQNAKKWYNLKEPEQTGYMKQNGHETTTFDPSLILTNIVVNENDKFKDEKMLTIIALTSEAVRFDYILEMFSNIFVIEKDANLIHPNGGDLKWSMLKTLVGNWANSGTNKKPTVPTTKVMTQTFAKQYALDPKGNKDLADLIPFYELLINAQ